MKKKLVLAAISGGVDSTVATALYIEKGYEVIGATLRLHSNFEPSSCDNISKEEWAAKKTCNALGIKHIVIDCQENFKNTVLKYSFNEYIKGRTPNPCAFCNRNLKFAELIKTADKFKAEEIITGHYTKKIIDKNGINFIKRGTDDKKDQSYFLCMLTPEQLKRISFPLANLTKPEVRKLAKKYKLGTENLKESQDVCFVQEGENFQDTLADIFSLQQHKGNIVDKSGRVLGTHNGIYKYTIGQRKGLNIAIGKPAFVSEIKYKTNEIVLSTDKSDLMSSSLIADNFNWFDTRKKPDENKNYYVQIRYRHTPVKSKIKLLDNNKVLVKFEIPQRAVTPGQAAAVYDNDILLGGGWINSIK